VPRLVGNPSKIGTDIGWSPEIDIDRTLDDVLAAARAAD